MKMEAPRRVRLSDGLASARKREDVKLALHHWHSQMMRLSGMAVEHEAKSTPDLQSDYFVNTFSPFLLYLDSAWHKGYKHLCRLALAGICKSQSFAGYLRKKNLPENCKIIDIVLKKYNNKNKSKNKQSEGKETYVMQRERYHSNIVFLLRWI
jgi:hypothetical protein